MAGRPPKPTPILKAQGTYDKSRHGKRADGGFSTDTPTCPRSLKGEARAEWKRAIKALAQAKVLCAVDRGLLAAWCRTWADYIAETDQGKCRRLVDTLVKLAREFGFSPVARAKVTMAGIAPEVDALDTFLGETG